MRLKCLDILDYHAHTSKDQEMYLKGLIPVPDFINSVDEVFGCDDDNRSSNKTWSLEVLTKYIHDQSRSSEPVMEVDISCPVWLADRFMSHLLPQTIPYHIHGRTEDLHCPVVECEWFKDMERKDLPRVQEIESYIQDLPEASQYPNLNEEILKTYFQIAQEVESLIICSLQRRPQVDFQIGPATNSCPLLDYTEKAAGRVLRMVEVSDTDDDQPQLPDNFGVKTFELVDLSNDCNDLLHEGLLHYQHINDAEVVQDHTKFVVEDLGEFDVPLGFDPVAFVLEKILPARPKVERPVFYEDSRFFSGFGRLLDGDGLKFDMKEPYRDQLRHMFELPEVIEETSLGSFMSLDLGMYIHHFINPLTVVMEVLDTLETASGMLNTLLVTPELTLDHSSFRSLSVPSLKSEKAAHITKDVFEKLSSTITLSLTSASDCLYLDWHLSQVGKCNNYTCFSLQKKLQEDQICEPVCDQLFQRKRSHVIEFLLGEDNESHVRNQKVTEECEISESYIDEVYPTIEPRPPATSTGLEIVDKGHSTIEPRPPAICTGAKIIENDHSDQSTLTDENKNSPAMRFPQSPSDPSTMASVLSLMKQARRGALPETDKSMQLVEGSSQVTENELRSSHNVDGPSAVATETYKQVVWGGIASSISLCPSEGIAAMNNLSQKLTKVRLDYDVSVIASHAAPPHGVLPQPVYPLAPPAVQENRENLGPGKLDLEETECGIHIPAESGPHVIVVLNTLQSQIGPVLLQRRRSYQKILGLDNEDLQVVERDYEIPVDLILSPSTTLIIYTRESMHRLRPDTCNTNSDIFSSHIDSTVEGHVKALSLSFQMCFMIFEGEPDFTSGIIRIRQKVDMVAPTVGMRVQSFVSGDPKCTDDLLLKCIKSVWGIARRPFDSPMAEHLTEGEVFLQQFPSLNPLSSHAILCLSVPLATFMSWSIEEQVSGVEGFDVPVDSLRLFHSQWNYMESERAANAGDYNDNPWPSSSEIITDHEEVDRHDTNGFVYFPPASELIGELETCSDEDTAEEITGVPSRPSRRGTFQFAKDFQVEKGNKSWDDTHWRLEQDYPVLTDSIYETSQPQQLIPLRGESQFQQPNLVQPTFQFAEGLPIEKGKKSWDNRHWEPEQEYAAPTDSNYESSQPQPLIPLREKNHFQQLNHMEPAFQYAEGLPIEKGNKSWDNIHCQPEQEYSDLVDSNYEACQQKQFIPLREKSHLQQPHLVQTSSQFAEGLAVEKGNKSWDHMYWQPEQEYLAPVDSSYEPSQQQQLIPLREKSHFQQPRLVQSSLNEWVQRRKREKQRIMECATKMAPGPSQDWKVPFQEHHRDNIPAKVTRPGAVSPVYGEDTNSYENFIKNSSLMPPAKRNMLALEAFRHKRGLASPLRPLRKKPKPTRSSNSFRVIDRSSAPKTKSQSCSRMNSPWPRPL